MRFTILKAPFKFASTQVAVLTVLVYAAVFASVLIYDELPNLPKNTWGLDLDHAYDALSKVRVHSNFIALREFYIRCATRSNDRRRLFGQIPSQKRRCSCSLFGLGHARPGAKS